MTETIVPDEHAAQGAAPQQQTDWQARYNGQQVKLQQNAATIQALSSQVAELQQQVANLSVQLGAKDGEHTTQVGQRDQTIQALNQEVSSLKTQIATLQGLQSKLSIVKKLNRPELISIMDAVPASEDPAQLEQLFNNLIGFTDSMVQARERQLTAGVTPTGGGNGVPSKPKPATSQDWEKHLNSLPLGSKERETAMNDWYAWTREQS
jgi:hypothetical protein